MTCDVVRKFTGDELIVNRKSSAVFINNIAVMSPVSEDMSVVTYMLIMNVYLVVHNSQ